MSNQSRVSGFRNRISATSFPTPAASRARSIWSSFGSWNGVCRSASRAQVNDVSSSAHLSKEWEQCKSSANDLSRSTAWPFRAETHWNRTRRSLFGGFGLTFSGIKTPPAEEMSVKSTQNTYRKPPENAENLSTVPGELIKYCGGVTNFSSG